MYKLPVEKEKFPIDQKKVKKYLIKLEYEISQINEVKKSALKNSKNNYFSIQVLKIMKFK